MAFVGLDMDQTLVSVESLSQIMCVLESSVYRMCPDKIKAETILHAITDKYVTRLLETEETGKTRMVRPGLARFACVLCNAKLAGKVSRVFIFSNNVCRSLIQLAAKIVNRLADYEVIHPDNDVFELHYPERKGTTEKSMWIIRNCLGEDALHPANLFFIDDCWHQLETSGCKFIRVPKYSFVTPLGAFVPDFIETMRIASDECETHFFNELVKCEPLFENSKTIIAEATKYWVKDGLQDYMTETVAYDETRMYPTGAWFDSLNDFTLIDGVIPEFIKWIA